MAKNFEKRIPKTTPVLINWENHSFEQFQTKDALGRTISFYIAKHTPANESEVPLITYIHGSGPASVFRKTEDGFWCGTNYDAYLNPLKNRAHFMVVEKPGVTLFDRDQGAAENWPPEFLFEHTLERWTEAIISATKAAQRLLGISRRKSLIIGHSEGAQVATHVAFSDPSITHVARIAGNGPTQLFGLLLAVQKDCAIQSKGALPGSPDCLTSSMATESVMRQWKDIVANKDSTTKFMSGHPYRRWYSFCSNSPMEDLLNCTTNLYMVHGTEDTSVPIISFDVLLAELAVHNRPFIAERIEGADHSLNVILDNEIVIARLPEVVQRIFDWFFDVTEPMTELTAFKYLSTTPRS
jgi:predicted esterase